MAVGKNDDLNSSKRIVKNSFFVSFFVLIGKVLGFAKQAVIAWAFGASNTTDTYFFADACASTIGQVMADSTAPVVTTNCVDIAEKERNDNIFSFLFESLLFFGVIGIGIVLLNMALSVPLSLALSGLNGSINQEQLVLFIVAISPIVFFMTISGVIQGYLNSVHVYIPGKLASLFLSVFIIVFVLFGN